MLTGKVMITGGTGSLGKAILARAHREKWRASFTILARNETRINEVRGMYPDVKCAIGDVRDLNWLNTIMPGHETVIHAAAIKIVPVAESSPREAVLTNVMGSINVAQAAIDAGVRQVVGISSDKVCGPTHYGRTKGLMEGIFREARFWSMGATQFVLCRYGNVLRSANSIVPLFEKQIREKKPFTVTDMRMTRFWLSMKQAIDLILCTLSFANNGEIFVPVAPAMKVADVAKALDPQREIVEIGIRAGERLHETLIVREEAAFTRRAYRSVPSTGGMPAFDIPVFVIQPPEAASHSNLDFQYEYTSDKPAKWLTSLELHQLLEDS